MCPWAHASKLSLVGVALRLSYITSLLVCRVGVKHVIMTHRNEALWCRHTLHLSQVTRMRPWFKSWARFFKYASSKWIRQVFVLPMFQKANIFINHWVERSWFSSNILWGVRLWLGCSEVTSEVSHFSPDMQLVNPSKTGLSIMSGARALCSDLGLWQIATLKKCSQQCQRVGSVKIKTDRNDAIISVVFYLFQNSLLLFQWNIFSFFNYLKHFLVGKSDFAMLRGRRKPSDVIVIGARTCWRHGFPILN